MKARIEKKLSKKIVTILPLVYKSAWFNTEILDSAFKQGSRVSHVLSVFFNQNQNYASVYQDFLKKHPEFGHSKITGNHLIKHAKSLSKNKLKKK